MTWVRSPAGRAIIGVAAIYALMLAIVFGARFSGLDLGGSVRAGIAVAIAIPVGWLMLSYWRAIDEAAREAQKWAWFWGGSAGLAIGLIATFWQPRRLIDAFAADAEAVQLVALGGGVVVAAELICFFIAWVCWWAARR